MYEKPARGQGRRVTSGTLAPANVLSLAAPCVGKDVPRGRLLQAYVTSGAPAVFEASVRSGIPGHGGPNSGDLSVRRHAGSVYPVPEADCPIWAGNSRAEMIQ